MSIYKATNLVGLKSGITFGTAEDAAAGDGIYVEEITLSDGAINYSTDADEYGKPIRTDSCVADHQPANATIKYKFSVMGTKAMEIIESIFSTYAYSVDTPVAGANTHTFTLLKTLISPIWHTLCMDRGTKVISLNSCLIESITISLDTVYKVSVTLVGDRIEDQAAFTNSVTYDDTVECYTHKGNGNNYVRINAHAGAGLTSSDNVDVSGVEIIFKRNFENCAPIFGGDTISDIYENAEPTVEVTLTHPKLTTDGEALHNAYQNQSEYKMEIYFEGSIVTGATPYSTTMQFPLMKIIEPPSHTNSTPYEVSVKYGMYDAAAAPTGMTTTVPKLIQVNSETTL